MRIGKSREPTPFPERPKGGTAKMTGVHQFGLRDPNLPRMVDRAAARHAVARRLLDAAVERINRAVTRLPLTVELNEPVKEKLLSSAVAAIEKLPHPYDPVANLQATMKRLLKRVQEAGVLIDSNGRAYEFDASAKRSDVEALHATYQAVATTIAAIRNEFGPEDSHAFLDEMEALLHPSRIATDALCAMNNHGKPTMASHQNERDALLGVLAYDCDTLIGGVKNFVRQELPQWGDVNRLECQVEELASKVHYDRGHVDLGEIALDRTPSLSERITSLADQLSDITTALAAELHDADPPVDIDGAMSLQQDLGRIFGEMHGQSGSSAETELQQEAIAKLGALLRMLKRWESQRV